MDSVDFQRGQLSGIVRSEIQSFLMCLCFVSHELPIRLANTGFQYVFPLCVRARGRVLILTTVIREIQTACGPTPAGYVNTTTEPSHPASRIKHPVEIKGFEIENLFHCQDLSELFSYDKEIFSTQIISQTFLSFFSSFPS